jgi:2-keto-3-deoxy-L-rhamnonate aldolase
VYSGFGQQLGPIVMFGAAGVIDGLAAWYPKTVVRLMSLVSAKLADGAAIEAADVQEMRRLQFAVSRAEEFIVRFGIVGIKEATFRVTGLGTLEGGRLPLKGKLADGDWETWNERLMGDIAKIEASL